MQCWEYEGIKQQEIGLMWSMFSDLFLFFSFYYLCLTLPRDDVDGSDAVGLTGLKILQLGTRYYGCTCSNKNLGAVNSPWAIIF